MSKQIPFFIIQSPDSFMLKKAAQDFAHENLPEKHQTYTFWGDEDLPPAFWDHLKIQGLFAENKLLIIRNLQELPIAKIRELCSSLNRSPSSVSTILCLEVDIDRGKPKVPAHIQRLALYKHCEKLGWIKTIPALNRNNLANFIETETKKKKIKINPSLLAKLVSAFPLEAAQISTELDKLALTADENGLVPDSSFSIINSTIEADIFKLLTAMQSGKNISAMWEQLLEYNSSGENLIFAFLAILSREARSLWQIMMGEQPSLPPSLIPMKKILAQSIGLPGIAKMWELAMSAEKGIKSGSLSPEQAFDFLAAELYILFHPTAVQAARLM